MIRYYILHTELNIYIPHYAQQINIERKSANGVWRTEIEVDEDYIEVAEDWMWNTDDIIEYGPVM